MLQKKRKQFQWNSSATLLYRQSNAKAQKKSFFLFLTHSQAQIHMNKCIFQLEQMINNFYVWFFFFLFFREGICFLLVVLTGKKTCFRCSFKLILEWGWSCSIFNIITLIESRREGFSLSLSLSSCSFSVFGHSFFLHLFI